MALYTAARTCETKGGSVQPGFSPALSEYQETLSNSTVFPVSGRGIQLHFSYDKSRRREQRTALENLLRRARRNDCSQ